MASAKRSKYIPTGKPWEISKNRNLFEEDIETALYIRDKLIGKRIVQGGKVVGYQGGKAKWQQLYYNPQTRSKFVNDMYDRLRDPKKYVI